MTNDEFQERCHQEFQAIHRKLQSLDDSLRGNGRPGINQRVGALEHCASGRKKLDWIMLTSIVGLVFAWCARLIFGVGDGR